MTHHRGQLHGRFREPFFFFFSPSPCSGVQSASICHCLATVPPGKMGLILQSISRRAAFVLWRAPVGPICFTAPSPSLQFDGSHFLSHLFVDGSPSLFGHVILFCFISLPVPFFFCILTLSITLSSSAFSLPPNLLTQVL